MLFFFYYLHTTTDKNNIFFSLHHQPLLLLLLYFFITTPLLLFFHSFFFSVYITYKGSSARKRTDLQLRVERFVNGWSPVYALRLMFRGDILLRHIRTFSLSKHTPIQRVKRVRQGNGSSSLVSLTQRCTRSDFVNYLFDAISYLYSIK